MRAVGFGVCVGKIVQKSFYASIIYIFFSEKRNNMIANVKVKGNEKGADVEAKLQKHREYSSELF